jgi:DnaK suppressor protein
MPAKKAAAKKSNKKGSKKTAAKVAKKRPSKKAPVAKKAARKKVSKKSASKRSAAASVTKRKTSKKNAKAAKPSAKKVSAKKASGKKTPKKVAKKKSVTKKKISVKKTASKKKTAKKTATTHRASSKKSPVTRAAARPGTTKTSAARRASMLTGPVRGFQPYQPGRGEDYMSAEQLDHFRQLLTAWKRELMEEVDRTMHHMKDDAANFPDPNDRATQESEFGLELRTRDRERKLLKKIDSALARIDDGSYGYCEETGDEIGLRRLEARPVATLCVEAQERRELAERQFRDREDYYR